MKEYISNKKVVWCGALVTILSILTFSSAIRISRIMDEYEHTFSYYLSLVTIKQVTPRVEEFAEILLCLLPFTVFQLFFGKIIHGSLSNCSAYIFTRQKSRVYWYIKKSLHLILICIMFNLLYYTIAGLTIMAFGIPMSNFTISFQLYCNLIITSSLFMFVFTMLINIITIITTNAVAVASVNIFLVGSVIVSIVFSDNTNLLKLNIIPHLIPSWHSFPPINEIQNPNLLLDGLIDYKFSIVYFFIMATIVLVMGALVIKRKDMSIEKE